MKKIEPSNDFTTSEAIALKKDFDGIGEEIKNELDKRIALYSNSLLFKYYSNFYYFLPKLCLLEIKDHDHNGYCIPPEESFFVEDKRKNKTLTYTTKSETIIAPIEKIKTYKNLDNNIKIALTFKNNFEYDYVTLWLNPSLCETEHFFAAYIFNKILRNHENTFATIMLANGTYVTKDIEVYPIDLQFKTTEISALKVHSPCCVYGFNIRIKDLFKYKINNIKKIEINLKLPIESHDHEKISSLFKVNLLPIFNTFNGYSHATTAGTNLSESKLLNTEFDDAFATDVMAIYENNRLCSFNNFCFKGQNEYYFNYYTQSLNYNTALPKLDCDIHETKIHTYSRWSQSTSISDLVDISSSVIASINCTITPIITKDVIHNYDQNTQNIYDLIDMLILNNSHSKTSFMAIIKLLKVNQDNILLLSDLIQEICLDNLTHELIIMPSKRYNIKHKHLLYFFAKIVCEFINESSFMFVKKIILNTQKGQ